MSIKNHKRTQFANLSTNKFSQWMFFGTIFYILASSNYEVVKWTRLHTDVYVHLIFVPCPKQDRRRAIFMSLFVRKMNTILHIQTV